MSSGGLLVRADGVGKKFCRDLKTSLWYGLKDSVSDLLAPRTASESESDDQILRTGEFWANKDISFELREGESLGLIGHNGAGKTTLLKMLNGLLIPDTGRIEIYGRLSALIALGAGFNPVLTGRENVFVNGAVLGLSRKEISRKFDEIVEFAELEDFIDTPVRNYSSGMQVRLGFASASVLNPEILLLDEVLAVGDIPFRTKCFNRLTSLKENGVSFILVTHQLMELNRWVDKCIYLRDGELLAYTDTASAIDLYLSEKTDRAPNIHETGIREDSGEICISDVVFSVRDGFYADLKVSSRSSRDIEFFLNATVTEGGQELLKFSVESDVDGKAFVATAQQELTVRLTFPEFFPQTSSWVLSVSLWESSYSRLHHWIREIAVPTKSLPQHYGRAAARITAHQS